MQKSVTTELNESFLKTLRHMGPRLTVEHAIQANKETQTPQIAQFSEKQLLACRYFGGQNVIQP